MPQIYFVDPCNEDRLEKQRRLSHAALISHRHRRLKNGSQTLAYRQREPKNRTRTEENRTINVEYDDGFFPWMSNGGAVTVSGNVTQRSEDDEGRQQDSVQEIVIRHLLSLFPHRRHKELAAPLALGKYASAEAHEGKNFFNVFAEDAQSLERIIYDPFSISRSGGFKEDSIEILANDVVFHAYYALAQAKREMRNQPNAAPSAHLLQHKGQALVKLQNWFKQKDVYEARREAITAMMLLTAVELFRGSQSSFKTHREAMGKLVVATGGFDSLIPKQQFALCELEMLWAIFTGYTVVDYKPKPRIRHKWSRIAYSERDNMPEGFWALALEGKLSGEAVDNITRILGKPRKEPQDDNTQIRRRGFNHYWAAFPCFHLNYKRKLTFEELLEVAMIQYCIHRVDPPYGPQNPSVDLVSRDRLGFYLPQFFLEWDVISKPEREALVWILMVTLNGWRRLPTWELLPKGLELQDCAHVLVPAIAEMEWSEVKETCQKFFWNDSLLQFCWRQYGDPRVRKLEGES